MRGYEPKSDAALKGLWKDHFKLTLFSQLAFPAAVLTLAYGPFHSWTTGLIGFFLVLTLVSLGGHRLATWLWPELVEHERARRELIRARKLRSPANRDRVAS